MRCRSEIVTHCRPVTRLSMTARLVVTCGEDCTLTVIRLLTDGAVMVSHVLQGHVSRVRCVSIDGLRLLSGSDDRSAKLWSVRGREGGAATTTLAGHAWPVCQVELAGSLALTADTRSLRLWSVPAGQLLRNITGVSSQQVRLDLTAGCIFVTGETNNLLCFTLADTDTAAWQTVTASTPAKCGARLSLGHSTLLLLSALTNSIHINIIDFLN